MKSTGAFRFLALGLGALLLGGCATQGSQNLEQRVQQHDAQLRQLQPNQADTWNQMQAMRQELNTLKGQMDDLNNAGGARPPDPPARAPPAVCRGRLMAQ